MLNVSATPPFRRGDHVYKWCNVGPIKNVFQHHAIVIDAWPSDEWYETGSTTSDNWTLVIADFSAQDSNFSALSSNGKTTTNRCCSSSTSNQKSDLNQDDSSTTKPTETPPGLCIYECPSKDWHKVTYGATGFWKPQFARTGSFSTATSDPPGLVCARVRFLLDHPHVIPAYHVIHSNCECVAVWCKTGKWTTVQGKAWLASGMAASLAAIAASEVLTVVGVPLFLYWKYSKQQRKEMTVALNQAFWAAAVAHPDVFVEYITPWNREYE